MRAIPYGRQNITPEDEAAVLDVMRSDFLTQGPAIAEFEKQFAKYIGAEYAVAVSNGTAALHLCTMALKVQKGSRVITSPITFAASANCVQYCGGEVFFADIDPETFLLDIENTKSLIESKPEGFFSGIIPVDLAGYPVNTKAFRELCDQHGLWMIEDACHAPGAKRDDYASGDGKYADLSIFSFHPVKHIATGEGGMITTNNKELYNELLVLRTHGITRDPERLHENHGGWYYEMQELGYNYRIPDMLAALGISQLKRADAGVARRNEIANRYDQQLSGLPIQLPARESFVTHAFHLYVIRTEQRKELYDFLRTKQIFCQVHYIPVHLMPYYKNFGWKKGDFPNAEHYYERCLSLPMFPSLTDEEQGYVIQCIRDFFKSH